MSNINISYEDEFEKSLLAGVNKLRSVFTTATLLKVYSETDEPIPGLSDAFDFIDNEIRAHEDKLEKALHSVVTGSGYTGEKPVDIKNCITELNRIYDLVENDDGQYYMLMKERRSRSRQNTYTIYSISSKVVSAWMVDDITSDEDKHEGYDLKRVYPVEEANFDVYCYEASSMNTDELYQYTLCYTADRDSVPISGWIGGSRVFSTEKEAKELSDELTYTDSNLCIKRLCRDCGTPFLLEKSEVEWYRHKELPIPTRCKPCREARKSLKYLKIEAGTLISCDPDASATVYVPNNVSVIKDYAFSGCNNIREIVLPNSLTQIGHMAFEYTSIERMVIPASVNSIGHYIFAGCEDLELVTIYNGDMEIADGAFINLSNYRLSVRVPMDSAIEKFIKDHYSVIPIEVFNPDIG